VRLNRLRFIYTPLAATLKHIYKMRKQPFQTINQFLILFAILTFASCDDGIDGFTSLVNIENELPGGNCPNGGYRFETGIDSNKNGILESTEIQQTEFICNGHDGQNSLAKYIPESSGVNCPSGGYKIETGTDTNANGTLDSPEIQQTIFVCNGMNGTTIDQLQFKVFSGVGANSSVPFVHRGDLIKFDINNYPGVDSVIFVVERAKTSDSNSDIIFELFDLTNGIGIAGSEIKTNSTAKTRIFSDNIFSSLPQSEIDLGLRIRSEVDGTFGEAENVYLFLYDRK